MKFRWQNAGILAILCVIIGAAVALTYSVAEPRIALQAEEAANRARLTLFPVAESFQAVELSAESGLDNCYAALKNGRIIGYTAQATVSGCQGMIEIISGMDDERRLVGVIVGGSGFCETPGLGSITRENTFTDQFLGLNRPAQLRENVDAVAGATISSAAVVSGVNRIGRYLAALMDSAESGTAPSAWCTG